MFFNILATFAEFEADLILLRTWEGMALARARGKLKGKQPKLKERQAQELRRMHDSGEHSISDLAKISSVSRPTVYRTLKRNRPLHSHQESPPRSDGNHKPLFDRRGPTRDFESGRMFEKAGPPSRRGVSRAASVAPGR